MRLNYYFVYDDSIGFTTKPQKANQLLQHIPLEMLCCPYGFIVPSGDSSLNLLDYFDTGRLLDIDLNHGIIGTLVTPSGKVYDYFNWDESELVNRRRVPVGKGAKHGIAEILLVEEQLSAALLLAKTPQEVIDIMERMLVSQKNRYSVLKISEIQALLSARGITEEPPIILRRTKNIGTNS